jgi:hypothetical protein
VADAYFSKQPFVDELVNHGFHVVSRFRKDSNLRYLYHGMHPKGPGRPRAYGGKVDFRTLRDEDFTACAIDEAGKWMAYYGRVNSPALNRDIGLVVVHDLKKDGSIKKHRIYLSTDLTLDGGQVLHANHGLKLANWTLVALRSTKLFRNSVDRNATRSLHSPLRRA